MYLKTANSLKPKFQSAREAKGNMSDANFEFWEAQFPMNDERRAMALNDPDVKKSLYKTSPNERVVSGDALLVLERLAAERYGLDVLETSRLLEEFWALRDARSGY
jgi:hypothetical protein